MLDPQKISIGRVRQAYGLNGNEVEKTIQVLWPDAVFPVELWSKVHEAYWRAFADSNQAVYKIESPALPEVDKTQKFFHTHLCSMDVMTFFRKLSLNVQASILQKGFNNILEETYEDIDAIYPDERTFLFSTLSRLETVDIYDQYSPDSELFEEKILSLPISSYHFINHIFPETVIVDKIAAIHYWSVIRGYRLRQEVKGITHALVRSVIKDAAQGTSPVPETIPEPSRIITETQIPSAIGQEAPPNTLPEVTEHGAQEGMTLIPRSLWERKKPQQVCDDMRVAGYSDDAPIAHALYYWVGIKQFTEIGTILRGDGIGGSARDKHARKHLKLAEGRYYTK
jgi:hypothetical protein